MKLYAIGGLGADERVFSKLELDHEFEVIHWIEPSKNENINDYCKRLSLNIDVDNEFGLIGVSFGGIVAIDLSKFVEPKFIILISSVSHEEQLPQKLVSIGRKGILKVIPASLGNPPIWIMNYLFSAVDKQLLSDIISDTNPKFVLWALQQIVLWKVNSRLDNVYRIHGTKDRLIPFIGDAVPIDQGGHFMVVDKAKEVSTALNQIIQIHTT